MNTSGFIEYSINFNMTRSRIFNINVDSIHFFKNREFREIDCHNERLIDHLLFL